MKASGTKQPVFEQAFVDDINIFSTMGTLHNWTLKHPAKLNFNYYYAIWDYWHLKQVYGILCGLSFTASQMLRGGKMV